MLVSDVVGLVGVPLNVTTQHWSEVWAYCPPDPRGAPAEQNEPLTYDLFGKVTNLRFTEAGIVSAVSGDYLQGEFAGLTKQEVLNKLGRPTRRDLKQFDVVYRYTAPGNSGTYKKREVHIDSEGTVRSIVAEIYYD